LIALRENMPLIVKETKIIDNLDESSRKCLKTLTDTLYAPDSTQSPGS
jgi:hypothetical protein